MKVMTILGTRPEIIRLSATIEELDRRAVQILVHTGQNFDERLSELFFRELSVRKPDVHLSIRATSFTEQVAAILTGTEALLRAHRPDRVLILGDTNSGISAYVACRMGIPVYHMEAGNRCYDDRVPEEVNRRVIDQCSRVLLPYTTRSSQNLLREGFDADRIKVTGNPIWEILNKHRTKIDSSDVLQRLELRSQGYFLVTTHRAENVDDPLRLRGILTALHALRRSFSRPVVCSVHPRTRAKMEEFGIRSEDSDVRFCEPFGFIDFVRLEKEAFCVLTDSGTVQEETCILHVPSVTMRDVTERPETIDCGSTVLTGTDPDRIMKAVEQVTSSPTDWTVPPEYLMDDVAARVGDLVTSPR
jgi:UDP-N-acetylglucosamine 2-epimerase (non-hydrolysing)